MHLLCILFVLQQERGAEVCAFFYGSAIYWDDDDNVILPPTCLMSKSLTRPLPTEINTKKIPKQTVIVTLLCVPRDDVHTSTMTRPVTKTARVMTPGAKNRRDGFNLLPKAAIPWPRLPASRPALPMLKTLTIPWPISSMLNARPTNGIAKAKPMLTVDFCQYHWCAAASAAV